MTQTEKLHAARKEGETLTQCAKRLKDEAAAPKAEAAPKKKKKKKAE